MDESQALCRTKKPETVESIRSDSTYMMFKNEHDYGDRDQKSGYLCVEELKILIGKGHGEPSRC